MSSLSKFHRYKHSFERKGYSLRKGSVTVSEYAFANDPQAYKEGDVHKEE